MLEFIGPDELDDEEETVAPDVPFDDALLAAVGGMENVTVENLSRKGSSAVLEEMATSRWLAPLSQEPYTFMEGPYEPRANNAMREDYPGLFDGQYGPTQAAMAAATTPAGAIFYFMTPELWDDVARASEDYFAEKIDERVDGQYERQVARERKKPGYRRQTREQIRVKLE
uniref:Uncharacterized protein n=1 Tax=Phytophthora ramorum TaxID=164328 RepID=H3GMZ9_PHYRM